MKLMLYLCAEGNDLGMKSTIGRLMPPTLSVDRFIPITIERRVWLI